MLPKNVSFALLLGISLLLPACKNNDSSAAHLQHYSKAVITLPTGESFTAFLSKTQSERNLGLSRIKNEDFAENSGMLFVYKETSPRQFWMPETYFDLDVLFLDDRFRIIDTHRALKHFPYQSSEGDVPHSRKVSARYVLEVKAESSLAQKLRLGMTLRVKENN